MVKGFSGKILRVNLTTGKITPEEIDGKIARDYLGGQGYADKILCDEVLPTVDPLSPENKAIISVGPLVGSRASTAGRVVLVTKAPLNNCIAGSNAGGFFAPELKAAGYDMVIIEGKAERPVYLWINDNKVELRNAKRSWGKLTGEVDEILKKETHREAKTMVVGPAGVKLSLISGVMVDVHRASGRSGVGAVFGSKNFQGIVVRGTKKTEFASPSDLEKGVKEAVKILAASSIQDSLRAEGTSCLTDIINGVGLYPIRNNQEAYSELASNINGTAIVDNFLTKSYYGAHCIACCGRVTVIREGKYKGYYGDGPEYETVNTLGAMCGIFDLAPIIMANYLCNDYGLDTISAGVTVACAMELYEKGYIPEKDVPFPIRFGDGDAVVKLVEMMGKREGIGDLLAQGSYRLAEYYGHPELSMSVKKQEFPAYDGRGAKGIGLEYATSNRGACHVRGYTIGPEVIGYPSLVDRLKYEGKAEICKNWQDLTAVINSTGMCLFSVFGLELHNYASLMRAATGLPYTDDEVLKAGERIWNLERLFILGAGITGKDDTLPPRMLEEPIPSGPSKGEVCELDRMLPEYYKLRGWDEEGRPTKEKLEELGL
jgi:aldehyde:ferredoxin oxidoreductase